MDLWVAFALGLGGSLHCAGMCGPLALALPGSRADWGAFLWGRLLYNGGRTATYATLGGAFGLAGGALGLAGWQQGVSVALGAIMLAAAVSWRLRQRPLPLWLPPGLGPLHARLGGLLRRERRGGLLLIGLLNGLLPCGLVYLALFGALAAGGPWRGMAYMAAFGAGTWPLLLGTALVGRVVRPRRWLSLRWVAPVGLALLGGLLVLRGLALDIPYVSPLLQAGAAVHHH